MGREPDEAIYEALANQSLRRPFAPVERSLADALDAIFARGEHDFDTVAKALQAAGVERPSGQAGPWTTQVLHEELKHVNASLDEVYAQRA